MILTIPNRYDPILFSSLIFEKLNFHWDRKKFHEISKNPEFLEILERNQLSFGNQNRERLAHHFNLKIYIEEDNQVFEFGNGKEIFLKKCLKNFKIFTCKYKYFYLPLGIEDNGKIISDVKSLQEFIGQNFDGLDSSFNTLDFCSFEAIYNLSINVYSKTKKKGANLFDFKTLRLGQLKNDALEVNLHFQKESNSFLLITSTELYFQNLFICRNKSKGCLITYSKKQLLINHEKTCKNVDEIHASPKIVQTELRNFDVLIKKMIAKKMLDSYPVNKNFIFFDIESVLPNTTYQTKKMRILSHHKLVSLAAHSYINGRHSSKVWVVKDDSVESEIEIVNNFIDFCLSARDKIEKDDSLTKVFNFLENQSNKIESIDFEQEEIAHMRQIFLPFQSLPVFGYNNYKYDNFVIFDHLLKVLDKKQIPPSNIKLLKKGPHYFSVQFLNLHFKDLINFSIPASLDKYLQTWTNKFQKLAYPYERFSSINEIKSCLEFPPKKDFFSSIKGDCDDELYTKCKKIYDFHHNLPETDPNYWPNFESYLKYYNLSDVKPVSLALLTQFETYESNFGLSPMQFLGLPSFARAAMLKMYDPKSPSMFTFPSDSDATKIFRENTIGGLCNCYIRHITTDSLENASNSAKFNRKGHKWSEIRFFDINSQYPSTFKNKFPCGLGFEWTNTGGILSKKLMTTKKISLSSIEWLDFMNKTDDRLIQKNGKRNRIIFGWGSSEVKIGPYKVDGFSRNGEKVLIYEFQGCFFHGCELCNKKGLNKNDPLRYEYLSKIANVEIITMQECSWMRMRKKVKWNSKISKILKVRKLSEKSFIEFLKNNSLYGFALVSIRALPKAKKFLDLNWPPLFFKGEITFEDLPDWMKNNTTPQDFPRKTVVQGMFHEKILLHTELLKFYVDNGFEILHVFKFFEYQGYKCLKIIHDKVYAARVEASKIKNTVEATPTMKASADMKATAVKLVSNSMYGQMLMVSINFNHLQN